MSIKISSLETLFSKAKKFGYFSIILIVLAFIVGTILRYRNLFNLGLVYDTVETQYTWGVNANRMGVIGFWRDYNGFFDYLPGALYIITGVEWVSKLLGDNPHAFVFTLKSLNWLAEIGFIASLVYIGKRYGKLSNKVLVIFAAFTYLIPSIWFVGEVWGQFDTLLVLGSVVSVILLYRGVENGSVKKNFYKDPIFWSGVVFGLGIWFKLQTALIIPVLVLFHLCYRNKSWIVRQFFGFLTGSLAIITIPLLVNPHRLGSNLASPYSRGDEITKGAATLWRLVGMEGLGSDKLFVVNNIGVSVSGAGMLLFTVLMVLITVKYLGLNLRKLPKISKVFPDQLSFLDFAVIMTISSSLYYMLFTKMHSRYLHMGMLFAMVVFVASRARNRMRSWLWLVLALSLSYFMNQVSVFKATGNTDPAWVGTLHNSFYLNVWLLEALVNLLCIIGFYLWVWNSKKSSDLLPK